MKLNYLFSLVSVFFLFQISSVYPIEVNELLDRMDRLYRSKTSFSKMNMKIVTPQWERTLKMDVWTKGLDSTFVLISYPLKDKGVATLKIENQMWNYFPKINKVIKVPPSMMMSSWMGSDFTNDDLVKESSLKEDYDAKLLSEKNNQYELELTPKKDMVTVWGKIIIAVKKDSLLPVQQDFYDEQGIKVRSIFFKDVKQIGNRILPVTMELIPYDKNKKGHQTIVHYEKIDFDVAIPDSIFTRNNLQKRR